ncbi:MAG TPA: hypothetical protein VFB28_01875 [Terriglobales bacterium]|nr:hypothetical protein [Terriglobales bacterium]
MKRENKTVNLLEEHGQSVTEYAMVASIFLLGLLGLLQLFGISILEFLQRASASIQ